MAPSLEQANDCRVFTQNQALDYIGTKVRERSRRGFSWRQTKSKKDEARDLLANVVLSHVPVHECDPPPQPHY